ncbi:MAG TPA: peptidogalycan biosysnthesis protein, partial [Thermoanaerobaculia bacterium]
MRSPTGNHGVAIDQDADPQLVWPGVTEALYRLRRADRLFGQTDVILVKDLPDDDDVAARAMYPYSYRPFATEPDMNLTPDPAWNTFDDYLASLRKDYRKAIRNTHKQIDEAGVRVQRLSAEDMHAESASIQRLYLDVVEKQRLRLITLVPSYLPAMAAAFGDDFVTTGCARRT